MYQSITQCFLWFYVIHLHLLQDDMYLYPQAWANSRDVREALHIREVCILHFTVSLIYMFILIMLDNILMTTKNLKILSGGDAMKAFFFLSFNAKVIS